MIYARDKQDTPREIGFLPFIFFLFLFLLAGEPCVRTLVGGGHIFDLHGADLWRCPVDHITMPEKRRERDLAAGRCRGLSDGMETGDVTPSQWG